MEKEFTELMDKFKTESQSFVKSEIEAATKGIITADELGKRLEPLATKETIEKLQEIVVKQGEKINELNQGKPERKQNLGEVLAKEFPTIQKNVSAGGSHKFKVDKTTIALTSITSDPMGMFLPGMAQIQSQKNTLANSLNSFPLGADSHGVIYWTDQTTRTNNAAARSDGSAAAEQVYAWTGYSETVDNISAMVPVHKEALKHISALQNEINMLLQDDCMVALDGYCYTGNGTAPQIGGIYTRATAFVPATFIAAGGTTYPEANLADLVVSMAAQIMKATKYNVDKVWVNPYDALKLRVKDTTGQYVIPPVVMVNGYETRYIDNIQVVVSNSVTVNTLVVGDSSKARLYTGGLELEVGYDLTGDFSKRILTVLANMENSLLIRNAEVDAFLKSTDINADIAALTSVTA